MFIFYAKVQVEPCNFIKQLLKLIFASYRKIISRSNVPDFFKHSTTTTTTIKPCNTAGTHLLTGYKKVHAVYAANGIAVSIQYSKICDALTNGTSSAITKYNKIRLHLLRICTSNLLRLACIK